MEEVQVRVEEEGLDEGAPVVFRDDGDEIRMAFDPEQISQSAALELLRLFVPRLAGVMTAVHLVKT